MNKLNAILIIAGSVFLAVYFYQYDPVSSNAYFLKCPTQLLFKMNCPLCGGQQYLHHLLHLNFATALHANGLLFIIFPIVVYHFFSAVLKSFHIKLPALYFKKTTYLVLFIIIVLFTILRNISHYPFNLLHL